MSPELSSLPGILDAGGRIIKGSHEIVTEVLPTLIKLVFRQDISDAQKLRAIKAIAPNFTHGFWEATFAPDRGYAPDPRKGMRGAVERDDADWFARQWFGKPSLKEKRETEAGYIVREHETRMRERKMNLTEVAADHYRKEGFINPDHIDMALEEGYTIRQFRQRVKSLVKEQSLSRRERLINTKRRTRTRDRIREEYEDLLDEEYYYGGR
jgi:hypothetical protein